MFFNMICLLYRPLNFNSVPKPNLDFRLYYIGLELSIRYVLIATQKETTTNANRGNMKKNEFHICRTKIVTIYCLLCIILVLVGKLNLEETRADGGNYS